MIGSFYFNSIQFNLDISFFTAISPILPPIARICSHSLHVCYLNRHHSVPTSIYRVCQASIHHAKPWVFLRYHNWQKAGRPHLFRGKSCTHLTTQLYRGLLCHVKVGIANFHLIQDTVWWHATWIVSTC